MCTPMPSLNQIQLKGEGTKILKVLIDSNWPLENKFIIWNYSLLGIEWPLAREAPKHLVNKQGLGYIMKAIWPMMSTISMTH